MVVYQPTQEKRGEEKNLSDPRNHKKPTPQHNRPILPPIITPENFFLPGPDPSALQAKTRTIAPFATPPDIGVFLLMDTYLWGIDKVRFL